MKKKDLFFIFLFSLCTSNKNIKAADLEFDALNLDELEQITNDDMQTINDDQQTTFFDILKTYQSWPTASKGWLDSKIEAYPKSFWAASCISLVLCLPQCGLDIKKQLFLFLIALYPLYESSSTLYKQLTDNE